MSSSNTVRDESLKYYAMVSQLVHYTSKFSLNDDGRQSKPHTSTRNRLSSSSDLTNKSIEGRRFRLAPIWPEWNETDINNESWDTGYIKKKETSSVRSRTDIKTNLSIGAHSFEDPEGKIELPSLIKVEQWKRPIDFLSPEKVPVIVDPELGIQTFDLITSNEHLHYSETMRNIISQITALWDICRKLDTTERTWRPWEHIYALNKVSKHPFITPYNPGGKYVVRLFFLGTWRKIIIDDSIPFDSENRCLLPQTTLSYELWPMLLTKALLKIISLEFNPLNDSFEYNETSIIHLLTGWIPEPIPVKYTYAEKIWNFLRYDRSNRLTFENDLQSTLSCGPVSLYKWINSTEETSDPMENLDDKNSKKTATCLNPVASRDSTVIKSPNTKENRTTGVLNPPAVKDMKKTSGINRGGLTDDIGVIVDDQIFPEAPKLIVFGTISHLQSTRISSYSEIADRSERLRRYNLNETFSTSVLLTTIRDIPLEPPSLSSSSKSIPAWKLIRPRRPKILPHAEPIIPHKVKPERWIEIASPYINYPTTSVLKMSKSTIRSHPIERIITAKPHSITPNPLSIIEVDEDEDIENEKVKTQLNNEFVRSMTSISLPTTKKELNMSDIQEKSDESTRSAESKPKRKISMDKTKRKSAGNSTKISSDTFSIRSKGGESEQLNIPIDLSTIQNNPEHQSSQSTSRNSSKKCQQLPKIWMDFDDFCSCFTSIIVYHNPRGYQYNHKHTEIKFNSYQPSVNTTPITKEKKKEPIIQSIPNLQDDKSSLYLFVDNTRETLEKNIELVISLTNLPRWYDAIPNETIVFNEKSTRPTSLSTEKFSTDLNLSKIIVSQKEIIPQTGSIMAEIYSWKSLSIEQTILRLHTTATKSALLTLPPGRHVLKLMNTCPFAFNLQILSDTNDFMLGDEDQLLQKIISVSENAEFIIRAEELFNAFEDSIQNFHLINQLENKLYEFFRFYCQSKSIDLNIQTCLHVFNQALYSTLRTIINSTGSIINPEIQFAWRCFTNDLLTFDILGAYEIKRLTITNANRHSGRTDGRSSANTNISKKTGGNREKNLDDKTKQPLLPHSSSISDLQEEIISDWLARELSIDEINAITSIQKFARGFLQRRIDFARKSGTEKNLIIQRVLQSTLSLMKNDFNKSSALLLFKNLLLIKPQLIQCFTFHNDDWNMVTYRDYNGIYQEQNPNTWFVLFREIFYVTEESLIVAKFLSHLSNSILRVINNDTYEEMPLVFNRLAPKIFTKNKYGYTFVAEGISLDQSITNGRFRLRLIASYTHLPEPRIDQITSSFYTKEIIDYYLPNKEQIICRYRVIIADDINQTGRNFHLASIHFSTSKSDVYMCLTIFDHNREIINIEGKGSLVVPAICFMRSTINISPSRPTSKTGGNESFKRNNNNTHRGSTGDLTTVYKERIRRRSNSQTDLSSTDGEEKSHKYIIQVKLLRKSWPLTLTQWQFIEQLKEQEKNDLKTSNRQVSPAKSDRPTSSKRSGQTSTNSSSTTGKVRISSGKSSATSTGRPNTGKGNREKLLIDISKPHWILRVVSDADKSDELIIKKDNEHIEELINMKKAWETFETGRAVKAMQTRQKFLDSLQIISELSDTITANTSEIHTDTETSNTVVEQQVVKQIPSRKRSPLSTKKRLVKDELPKCISPQIQIDEPLLDEPPQSLLKPKISLPPLDLKSFIKSSNEPISSDLISEHRQKNFHDYFKYLNNIRQYREDDYKYRSEEKIRQLEEYINLQARIDYIRHFINQPREEYRQRYLEIERQRLQILAIEKQRLLDEEKAKAITMIKPIKKKTSTGKKKKKINFHQ